MADVTSVDDVLKHDKYRIIFIVSKGATPPEKNCPSDAGIDIFANEDVTLYPNRPVTVTTGLRFIVEDHEFLGEAPGFEIQVRSKSGLFSKQGIMAFPGTIDRTYRGPIKVGLVRFRMGPLIEEEKKEDDMNNEKVEPDVVVLKKGTKIAQLVICQLPNPRIFTHEHKDKDPQPLKKRKVHSEDRGGGHGSSGLAPITKNE